MSDLLRRVLSREEPRIDRRREITTALHWIARDGGWNIGPVHWDIYPLSFHWVELSRGGAAFAMLIHGHSSFSALSSNLPDYFNLAFVDDPALSALCHEQGMLSLLTAADLNEPLTETDRDFMRSLGQEQAHNMKYWRPTTVGDVIFNWWD